MAISFIRTVIVFVALMMAMRFMGKRQLGELEPNELVVAILISDLASHPLQDHSIPLIYGLVPIITLLCCEIIISGLELKSSRFRVFMGGKPSIIIDNGRICEAEMKKNRLTLDELTFEMRQNNVTDISTVKYGILETNGRMSVIVDSPYAPLTPEQMNICTKPILYPVIIISDGRVLTDNLKVIGFNEAWLKNLLKSKNISSTEEVYLLTADSSGDTFIQRKEAS